ncbi:hypothetical protein ACVIU7_003144 [Bradyrhizobium liaoningense]
MPRYSAQPELTKGSKLTAKDVAELRSRRRSSVSLTLPWRGRVAVRMPRYSAQPALTKGSKLTAKDVAELREQAAE